MVRGRGLGHNPRMSAGLDALARYLDALPAGLDSYPECQIKGSVVQESVECLALQPVAGLPEALGSLLTRRLRITEWIPEVHFYGLMSFARGQYYGADAEFGELMYRSNFELLDSIAYRALFRLVGPKRLLEQVGLRWGLFHRGSRLEVLELERQRGVLHQHQPAHECPEPMLVAYAMAVKASLTLAGAKEVRVQPRLLSPTLNEYRFEWD